MNLRNIRLRFVRIVAAFIAITVFLVTPGLEIESISLIFIAVFSAAYAIDPSIYRFIGGDFDPEKPFHGVTLLITIFTLSIVIVQSLTMLFNLMVLGNTSDIVLSKENLAINLLLNTGILLGTPLVWVYTVNSGKPLSKSLGISLQKPVKESLIGAISAVVSLFLVFFTVYILVSFVGFSPENPLAEEIISFLNFKTALLVSLAAAVGEEVFFRGFLQTRIGILPAAVLFSISHSSYGVATQLIGPFIFGLVLGIVYKWRKTVLAPIVGHFLFNYIIFLATLRYGFSFYIDLLTF